MATDQVEVDEFVLAPENEAPVPLDPQLSKELGLSGTLSFLDYLHSHRWTFASLGVHALMLACFALMPPKSSALAMDMLSDDARYARYLSAPMALTPPMDLFPTTGADPNAGGARAAEAEGEAGTPTSSAVRRRASGGGKVLQTNAREEARTAGILGVLASNTPISTFENAFNNSNGFGYGSEVAIGALMGATVGDSHGFHGLGMRGTGRGGGGDAVGTVGVGRIGDGLGIGPGGSGIGGAHSLLNKPRKNVVPHMRSGEPDVRGSLSKEVIRRSIQRHLNEVRFCYEQALHGRPDLSGRIQVGFMIAPSGVVQSAQVVESSVRHGELESCITKAVLRWSFPAPDGGGYVSVRYPFVMEQAGGL